MKERSLKLFEALAYSNFIVALGAASLGYLNTMILALPQHQILTAFLFTSTFLIYNLQRRLTLSNDKQAETELEKWNERNKNIVNLLTLISLAFSLYFYLKLPFNVALVVIPLAVISFAYVLPFKNGYSLRELPYLKVLIVSFSWAITTVILPILSADANHLFLESTPYLLIVSIMAFVFAESLPFDIRDLYIDQKNRLKTIPLGLGVKKSLILSVLCFSLTLSCMLYLHLEGTISSLILWCFALSVAVALLLFLKIKTGMSHLYYALLLDSVLFLPLSFYLLLS